MMFTPWKGCHLENEKEYEQEAQALIPLEQQTILFYGKPLVVVRLPE